MARLAVLFEHPTWFRPLFAALERAGIAYEPWRAEELAFAMDETDWPDLVFNRMSASAAWRGHGRSQFAVRELLAVLEARRVPVINGLSAYELEISKIRQLELFRRAGACVPRTAAACRAEQLPRAAGVLPFPVIVKPNCGGAGAGVRRFDTPAQLASGAREVEFGCDHTALVQELIPSRDGACYRIEILDGELLYCLKVQRDGMGYNLCPADACESAVRPVFTRCEPMPEAEALALNIARLGRIDLCGIEYIVDHRTGEPVFYDLNVLSNFVADAPAVVGFDPYERLAEYLGRRLHALGRVR
ncbi:MAG: ATP-grasp domain-containing protein [Bryobacteraceae bacterium]